MKKIISISLAFVLALSLFAGCGGASTSSSSASSSTSSQSSQTEEKTTIRVGGLTGPTMMGMVKLMDDSDKGKTENSYKFTVAGTADELTPQFIQGNLDILAVPANLASVLYNKTNGNVKFLAVNTLGVLYIVEKGSTIKSMADLKGKTIYATSKGATTEYTLRYLLTQNGIDPDKDVTIEWKSEPTEVVSAFAQGTATVAMLPQPYVTVAQNSVQGLNVALSLTDEWNKLNNGTGLITAGVMVNAAFAEKYPNQVDKFLEEYEASTKYVNANVDAAATLCENYNIVKAAVAKTAIPYCNITCVTGDNMKKLVSGYLNVLYSQNAASVGGKLPGDDFYYEK